MYCTVNGQILANGYSFVALSQPAISKLTSWFSRSGSGPRHIHWKGIQWTSTIVKHSQSQTGLFLRVPKNCFKASKSHLISKVNKSDYNATFSQVKSSSSTKTHRAMTVCLWSCLLGGAASCPRPSVHVAGLWSTGFQAGGGDVRRRHTHSKLPTPPTASGLWSRFCARTANHKQSLIINSDCSFSVPGSTEQLASACDLATAEVSISHTTDRKRALKNGYVVIYLTLKGTLDGHTDTRMHTCTHARTHS